MKNNTTLGQRLQQIADYLCIPLKQVYTNAGYSQMTIWRLNNEGIVSEPNIAKAIASAYPELNYNWLLTGEDKMWALDFFENRFKLIKSAPKDNADLIKKLYKAFELNQSQLSIKVQVSRSTIMRLENGEITAMKDRTYQKFRTVFPFIPREWFTRY